MKNLEAHFKEIKKQYPKTMSKDQLYRVAHISKATALYLLQSGAIPCKDTGKKTRRYTIKTDDVIENLRQREICPEKYKASEGWYAGTAVALSEGFFNYEEKNTLKTSAIHCPARIPPEKAAEIQAAAKTIYRALDCRVFARVDLFLTPDGEIVFNEVNTIPGFTAHSRYPSMMQGIGISFGELVTRLIELGVVG